MKGKGRTENALLASLFTYAQFAISLGAAFVVTPLILRKVGVREYGLWLSSGELVGYVLLLDFGVFSILPWLIARAHGQQRPDELKRFLVQGLAVAIAISILLLLGLVGLGVQLPALLHLTPSDWQGLRGPLFLLVILLAANLPTNVFVALLSGLQDVRFTGPLNLVRAALAPMLTAILLWTGYGLYALALGTAVVSLLMGLCAFFRARHLAPALLRRWPRPSLRGAMILFRESVGAWLGSAGVQMMERSSAVILTWLRFPAIVPVLICTSRLGQTLTQMAWVMPDSALIGFAQLSGEQKAERTREVALAIIKLNFVLAGMAACVVLALNPTFVRLWVGQTFFGGLLLNLLLAAEVITGSLTHSLACIVAVHGKRLAIGLTTLAQSAIYIVTAVMMSRRFLLEGLLIADLLAPLCSTIPVALWLLRSSMGMSLRRIARDLGSIFFLKAGPCLSVAGAYSFLRGQQAWLLEATLVGLLIVALYVRLLATEIATFPLPRTAKNWLIWMHLI